MHPAAAPAAKWVITPEARRPSGFVSLPSTAYSPLSPEIYSLLPRGLKRARASVPARVPPDQEIPPDLIPLPRIFRISPATRAAFAISAPRYGSPSRASVGGCSPSSGFCSHCYEKRAAWQPWGASGCPQCGCSFAFPPPPRPVVSRLCTFRPRGASFSSAIPAEAHPLFSSPSTLPAVVRLMLWGRASLEYPMALRRGEPVEALRNASAMRSNWGAVRTAPRVAGATEARGHC